MMRQRALISLQEAAQVFDISVNYASGSGAIVIRAGSTIVTHIVGNTFLEVNGVRHHFDVPSIIIDGDVFVPLRIISEALGYEVLWEPGVILVNGERIE